MGRLGVVTIGQAPRSDMVPEMAGHWPGMEVVERGALDDLEPEFVRTTTVSEGDEVLTSLMRDGRSAVFGRDLALKGLQTAITTLEHDGVDAVLLLCTGAFPSFHHRRPLYRASPLLINGVTGLASGPVGVIAPLPSQEPDSARKFRRLQVLTANADPYRRRDEDLANAAVALVAQGASLLVLDCMGYTEAHRTTVRRAVPGVPVVVARSLVARMAAEVMVA